MVKRLFVAATLVAMGVCARAQATENADEKSRVGFGMTYTTELQTSFKKSKWVNLLRMDLSVELASCLSLNMSTLSTAQTNEQTLINDMQGFSNIEAENIALTLALLSLDWHTEHTTLSVGVRNPNENYFATDLLGLFTQSSHGIFPTLSANFSIPNYPLAAIGADFQWRMRQFTLDASVYNGTGYSRFAGRRNLFRFCPKSDGVFGIASLSHEASYGNSHVGVAVHNAKSDENPNDRKTRTALWAYTELALTDNMQMLAQYSMATGSALQCRHYAGLGLKRTIGSIDVGIAETFGNYNKTLNEWCTELTAQIPLDAMCKHQRSKLIWQHLTLQPALHIVHAATTTRCAALLRLCVSL